MSKNDSNRTFEVINADGTRERFSEGIFVTYSSGDAILRATTEREELFLDAAELVLRSLGDNGIPMCALAVGMALDETSRKVLADLVECGSEALAVDVEKLRLFFAPDGSWLDEPLEEVQSEHS